MAKPTFNQHFLADFSKLSIGDHNEIEQLENELKSHGWCFVQLQNNNNKLKHVIDTVSAFFNQSVQEKSQYESSHAFGYLRNHQKQNIRVLMNEQGLGNYHQSLASDLEEVLKDLSVLLASVVSILKSIILRMHTITQSLNKDQVLLSSLYMLDIVRYLNEKVGPAQQPEIGFNTDEVNCVPHFDPGLFSLSILSTCDGLQLKDLQRNVWIDGPNNLENEQSCIGVIWLGEAAHIMTGAEFKSGIHRVVYPRIPHQERLTIWLEVCTQNQIERLLKITNDISLTSTGNPRDIFDQQITFALADQDAVSTMHELESSYDQHNVKTYSQYDNPGKSSALLNDSQNVLAPEGLRVTSSEASVTMTNQPGSRSFYVDLQNETLDTLMKRVENERGLPVSKSGVEHLKIRFPVRVRNTTDEPNRTWSFFSSLFKW